MLTSTLRDVHDMSPTSTGKVYCSAVVDTYSRMVVGWTIADHMRSELVVDAVQMAI